MNITLDKEEDLKDRMIRYAQIVDSKKLQEYLDSGISLEFCMENMLAINVKMDIPEYTLRIT